MRFGRMVWLGLGLGLFVSAPGVRAQKSALAGTLVVVNRADATVSLVDLATRDITATIPVGEGPHEVAVSPDGRWALVSNYGPVRAPGATLSLIDVMKGTVEKTISITGHRRPHGIAWLPDGKSALVTTESDSALLVVDVQQGTVVAAISTGQTGTHLVALSADGTRAYVTNIGSSSVTAIDVTARQARRSFALPEGAEGIALRPDGDELWVSSRVANRITVLAASDLTVRATIDSRDYPLRIRFTPDGMRALVTFAKSAELKLFNVAARKEEAVIPMRVAKSAMHGANLAEGYEYKTVPLGLALSPDGAWAFVALGGSDAVSVVSLRDRDTAMVIFVGREPDGVAYSPLVRRPAE